MASSYLCLRNAEHRWCSVEVARALNESGLLSAAESRYLKNISQPTRPTGVYRMPNSSLK